MGNNSKSNQLKKKHKKHKLKIFIREIVYYLALIFLLVVRFLPYDFIVNTGGFLAIFYFKISKDRKDIINNMKIAFPEKTDKEILELKKLFSLHIGKTLFEFLKMANKNGFNFKERCEALGLEYLEEASKQKKGILLLSGHIGNWELFAAYLAHLNYIKINVVAKRIYYDKLNNLLINIRQLNGVYTLMRNESTKDMVKCLKNNEALGILIDQDTNVKSSFVNFFCKPAKTPIGAALLALHYDCIVLPTFITRIDKNRHKLVIKPPLDLIRTDNNEADIIANTRKFNEIIETQIRKNPAQWVWMHNRWKNQNTPM